MTSIARGARSGFVAAAAGLLGLVLASEYVHRRGSRAGLGDPPATPRSEAVLVLGYRNGHPGRANALNRWRVRAGLRSRNRAVADSVLVFSGGAAQPGTPSEAASMARYAVTECGVPEESILLEEKSSSTWENIEFSAPFLRHAESIVVVSDPLHALKARLYLAEQRPDLARRLAPGRDYRFGEHWYLKPIFAVKGGLDLWRWRRSRARGIPRKPTRRRCPEP